MIPYKNKNRFCQKKVIDTENFFEAAVRHWYDGKLLENHGEYDNAVCMQGFAAESALKKILMSGIGTNLVRKYSHQGEALINDLEMLLMNDDHLLSVLDPASGLRLSNVHFSSVLFSDHPERRYFEDGKYSEEDAAACRESAEFCIREMYRLYLDGYISIH